MRFFSCILLLLTVFSINSFCQIPVDTIIEKTLQAIGGRDKFDGIEAIYKEGKLIVGMGGAVESDRVSTKVRTYWIPFKGMKTEIQDENNIMGSVFTPTRATRYNILVKSDEVEQFENVSEYETKTAMDMFNKFSFLPEFCLNSYNTARNTILSGYEYVDGKRCYKLIYKQKNIILINEKTYLPEKYLQVYVDYKDKKPSFVEYYFSDYRPTNTGLIMPFLIEQIRKGNDIPSVCIFNKIQVNENVPREEILEVSEYKKKNDIYVEKMGKIILEQKLHRKKPKNTDTLSVNQNETGSVKINESNKEVSEKEVESKKSKHKVDKKINSKTKKSKK